LLLKWRKTGEHLMVEYTMICCRRPQMMIIFRRTRKREKETEKPPQTPLERYLLEKGTEKGGRKGKAVTFLREVKCSSARRTHGKKEKGRQIS